MSERYIVIEGSESAHCCFTATVVDTQIPNPSFSHGNTVCECFDMESAQKIAAALNADCRKDEAIST